MGSPVGLDDHCGRVAVGRPVQQLVEIRRAAAEPDGQDDPVVDARPFVQGVVHEHVRDGMAEVVRRGIGMHQIGLHELDAVRQPDQRRAGRALQQACSRDLHPWTLSQGANQIFWTNLTCRRDEICVTIEEAKWTRTPCRTSTRTRGRNENSKTSRRWPRSKGRPGSVAERLSRGAATASRTCGSWPPSACPAASSTTSRAAARTRSPCGATGRPSTTGPSCRSGARWRTWT